MQLHLFYVLAGHEQEILPKTARLSGLRLRLPNGEEKVPHGGLALLCQVGNPNEGLDVQGQRLNLVGRALVRGAVRTPTGSFRLEVPRPGTRATVSYALQATFHAAKEVPDLPTFRGGRVVEFVVTELAPADDPCWLLCDPEAIAKLERRVRRQGYDENEMTTDDLVQLLGGQLVEGQVRFDSEGAFREL